MGFGVVGVVFFGVFVYLMLPTSKWKAADTTGMTIMWIILGAFIFFQLLCLFAILTLKSIVLTDKKIVIKRPLLFFKLTIPLSNVKNIVSRDYNIRPSHDGIDLNVFNGYQTIIELTNGKKIKFTSFEISDYASVTKNLRALLTGAKQMKLTSSDKLSVNKYEGYGWLVFLIIVTLGLIFSIVKQQL